MQSLLSFMEASNELGTVKNQTILTAIPGLRKIPGNFKDLYDNVVEERDKLQKYFLDEGQVSVDYIVRFHQQLNKHIHSYYTMHNIFNNFLCFASLFAHLSSIL